MFLSKDKIIFELNIIMMWPFWLHDYLWYINPIHIKCSFYHKSYRVSHNYPTSLIATTSTKRSGRRDTGHPVLPSQFVYWRLCARHFGHHHRTLTHTHTPPHTHTFQCLKLIKMCLFGWWWLSCLVNQDQGTPMYIFIIYRGATG